MATFDFKFVNDDSTPSKAIGAPASFTLLQSGQASLADLSWQLAALVDPTSASQKLKEFHRLCRNGFVKKVTKGSVDTVLQVWRGEAVSVVSFCFRSSCFG